MMIYINISTESDIVLNLMAADIFPKNIFKETNKNNKLLKKWRAEHRLRSLLDIHSTVEVTQRLCLVAPSTSQQHHMSLSSYVVCVDNFI